MTFLPGAAGARHAGTRRTPGDCSLRVRAGEHLGLALRRQRDGGGHVAVAELEVALEPRGALGLRAAERAALGRALVLHVRGRLHVVATVAAVGPRSERDERE